MTSPANLQAARQPAGKIRPKAVDPEEISHPVVIEQYRRDAAQITRNAIERYRVAETDFKAALEARYQVDQLRPRPSREQETGKVELTPEQRARYAERMAWEQFYQAAINHYQDTLNFLLHTIVRWDSSYVVQDSNLDDCSRRGVIHGGTLYLALPDDEDDEQSAGAPVLHVVPLASIVDLDREAGQ